MRQEVAFIPKGTLRFLIIYANLQRLRRSRFQVRCKNVMMKVCVCGGGFLVLIPSQVCWKVQVTAVFKSKVRELSEWLLLQIRLTHIGSGTNQTG